MWARHTVPHPSTRIARLCRPGTLGLSPSLLLCTHWAPPPLPALHNQQVAEELFEELLAVEEVFGADAASGATTEQEVIDGLRKVRVGGLLPQ